MKEKTELLINFKWNLKNVDPNGGKMLQKEIQILYNFSFWKIVEIMPPNKVQSLFFIF
jgi:hypothetical protein